MGMVLAVLFILSSSMNLYLPVESWSHKSFKRLSLSGGDSTCAVDTPNSVVPLNVAFGNPSAVPPGVSCAWVCMADANCTSYNFNEEAEMCEMFFYRPSKTLSNRMCTYFMVCFGLLILGPGNSD